MGGIVQLDLTRLVSVWLLADSADSMQCMLDPCSVALASRGVVFLWNCRYGGIVHGWYRQLVGMS